MGFWRDEVGLAIRVESQVNAFKSLDHHQFSHFRGVTSITWLYCTSLLRFHSYF